MSRRYKKESSCWDYRTGLEKILIAATITAFVVVIALMVIVILLSKPDIIQNNTYIAEPLIYKKATTNFDERIDPSINPCDDFYRFACGNLLKKANGDENLGPFYVIQERASRQIEEMYNEPVKSNDHKIVKVAKNLYKHCMNESAIERDGLETIKIVLHKLGGWPVVDGIHWDESKFQWMHAEYVLREFGYFYSSFLTVNVVGDPVNDQKFIYQISMPNFDDFDFEVFEKERLMVDIAVAFGADESRAILETAEILEFMLDIKREIFIRRNDEAPQRMRLSQIHKQYPFINWIEFIDNIVGSAIRVSRDDYILIPPIHSLKKWYKFIEKTPKRTQANYMLWKVIEKLIPITPTLEKLTFKSESNTKRSTFCIKEIRNKFTPSPIDLMYVRTYLPAATRLNIQKIIKDMKWELQDLLEKIIWPNLTEKYNAIKKVTSLKEVIGAPEELLDDEILEDINFDLKITEKLNFLELVAQVDRSHQSWLYNQMYTSKSEIELTQWKLQTASAIGDYYYKDNIIILPATIFQNVIYDEKRPEYFNYGSIGTMMGHHFMHVLGESNIFDKDGNVIENVSTNFFYKKAECFKQQMNPHTNQLTLDLMLPKSLGLQLAYSAFQKKFTVEDDANYTPAQLFWISSASYYCHPSKNHKNFQDEEDLFSLLTSVPIRNNANFGKDFNCRIGAKMNPERKCEIFV
ncbi:hypothetical protein FQR65_LT06865 [Abscondita terminalis]|nr:hypothetical protein FQR65_LT06865 [Abscondita terminalis]